MLGKHMKMLGFKFEQNRTISEEFDFLRGEGVGQGVPIYKFYSQLLLANYRLKYVSAFPAIIKFSNVRYSK